MKRLICAVLGHARAYHPAEVWNDRWKEWWPIMPYPDVNVEICSRCRANLNGWTLRYR